MSDQDRYLQNILVREAVNSGANSPVLSVGNKLAPIVESWAGGQLRSISPSGSFAKGTANKSGTDIDLFISLTPDTTNTLKEIYEGLAQRMIHNGYTVRRQNVSINVQVDGYSVDLVPGKCQDSYSEDHSLYRRKADTWTKTNIIRHIRHVRGGQRLDESRILKLWRNQHKLEFPSFYLELIVMNALPIGTVSFGLATNVRAVFRYLQDSFADTRVVDPANTNNIISDDLTRAEKLAIKSAATNALTSSDWRQIVA